MNAPNKGCTRARHKAEIPFSWLTGFLPGCLLTSYCKGQMPCKPRPKVRGGFLPGMEKNMRTDHDKGPDWSVVDNSLYAFVRKMGAYPSCTYCTTYALYEGIQLCLHCGGNAHLSACLLSPLSQFCSLADCSAPSLVAAPPSSPSQWCWALVPPSDTLSHSPVTEQRG